MPDAFSQEPRAGGLSGVRSTDRLERPEIVVRPDLNRPAEPEVSSATFGELTRTDIRGGFDSPLPQLVTKNSILLVEYAVLTLQERGLSVIDALLDACHRRIRPIAMTTVAMIAGTLPIALALGADAAVLGSAASPSLLGRPEVGRGPARSMPSLQRATEFFPQRVTERTKTCLNKCSPVFR